jgi:hypothetical protein
MYFELDKQVLVARNIQPGYNPRLCENSFAELN